MYTTQFKTLNWIRLSKTALIFTRNVTKNWFIIWLKAVLRKNIDSSLASSRLSFPLMYRCYRRKMTCLRERSGGEIFFEFHFWKKEISVKGVFPISVMMFERRLVLILRFYTFGKSETIGSGKIFKKRDVYSSVWDSCLSRNLYSKPGSELIHSFVNRCS